MLTCQGTMGPQPIGPLREKELREGNSPPSGTGLLLLDVSAPGRAGDPPCCSRKGGTCVLQASHSRPFCSCTWTGYPHPFRGVPDMHPPQGLGWVLLQESRALFSFISVAAVWPG